MLNINELESRWLHYKLKSLIPYAVILISVIIIGILFFSFEFKDINSNTTVTPQKTQINKEPTNTVNVKEQNITLKTPILEPQIAIIVPPIEKAASEQKPVKKMLMEPSLTFMNSINHNVSRYHQADIEPSYKPEPVAKKIIQTVPVEQNNSPKKPTAVVVEIPEVEIVSDTAITIQRQNTYEDIQHVVKRFKKSNNPALSLFVAKKYYEIKDYNQAYNYALITNELNNDIEESWIIFAKTLVKLDKKAKAIEILKKYINNSHSQRAQILLDNINSGKMR